MKFQVRNPVQALALLLNHSLSGQHEAVIGRGHTLGGESGLFVNNMAKEFFSFLQDYASWQIKFMGFFLIVQSIVMQNLQ